MASVEDEYLKLTVMVGGRFNGRTLESIPLKTLIALRDDASWCYENPELWERVNGYLRTDSVRREVRLLKMQAIK